MSAAPKITILGTRIDPLTVKEAVELIAGRATQKGSCYVTKPYVEFVERAATDAKLRQILNAAWLSLPDGISLKWAAHYLYAGRRSFWRWCRTLAAIVLAPATLSDIVPEHIGGTRFTWPLLARCQAEGLSVFLVGSPRHQHINQVAASLSRELPGLVIAGTFPGRLTPSAKLHLIEQLQQTQPHVILVGMGFPRQERLMHELAAKLERGVLIGEGGTFDYESFGGQLKKAPDAWQRLGLEWFWRLLLQPWRLGRQLAIPRFMWHVYAHRQTHPQITADKAAKPSS